MSRGRRPCLEAAKSPRRLAAGAAALLSTMGPACVATAAEPRPGLLVGTTVPAHASARRVPLAGSGGVVWEGELQVPGAAHLYVVFDHVRLDGAGTFTVRLSDNAGGELTEIPGAEFAAGPTFVTGEVRASDVHVQVVATRSTQPSYLSFDIDEVARDPAGLVLQSVQRPGAGFIPVTALPRTDPVRALSRSLLRISIPHVDQEGRRLVYSCSGFFVGDGLAVTNQHCLSRGEDCPRVHVYASEGDDLTERDVGRCAAILDSSYLLDATVFAVDAPSAGTHPSLQLADSDPTVGEALQVLGHPDGGELDVSRTGCKVDVPSAPGLWDRDDTDFAHSCGTTDGSSGSPILDDHLRVVGLHHLGYDTRGPWSSENRAIKGSRLAAFVNRVLSQLTSNQR